MAAFFPEECKKNRHHCCPVKSYAPSRISSIDAACRPVLFGADLNFAGLKPRTSPELTVLRSAHVGWQDPVRPGHGVRALNEFSPHRPILPRPCRGSHPVLRRAVSHHGVRATDVQREPAHPEIHRHQRERRQDAVLVRCGHLCVDCHRQEGASPGCLALHMPTGFVGLGFRENPRFHAPCSPVIYRSSLTTTLIH